MRTILNVLKTISGGTDLSVTIREYTRKGGAVCCIIILCLLVSLSGCFHGGQGLQEEAEELTPEQLEQEYVRLKTKYELLKSKAPKRYLLLEDADGKIEKTAQYYYQKGLDFQEIDTLTAYDYFKEVYRKFPDDERAQDAHEQMVRIERTLYDAINKELNGKETLNDKIECLEQNLLVYHDYLNKSFLELLIHELRKLKFQKENKS